MHYHEGTEHFFSIVEIEGGTHEVPAACVWIGEGGEHHRDAREGQDGTRRFEFVSDGDHETVYT